MNMMTVGFDKSAQRRAAAQLAGCTILHVAPSLMDKPGRSTVIDHVRALADAGARPLVAAPAGPLVSEIQAIGGIWIDFPSRTRNPLAMVIQSLRLRRIIAAEGVELVHALSRRAAWMAYGATRNTAVPLVTSLPTIVPGQSVLRQRYTSVLARGEAVITGSKFAADTITSLYPKAAGQVVVVRPGLDLKPFAPGAIAPARVHALREAWSVDPDDRIILMVAEPSVWKGHKVLIEAVRLLHERGERDLRLVFVGEGKGVFGRELEAAARTAAFQSPVVVVADCRDRPAALLAAAAVVVPSMEVDDFGRIAIEAQAVGTPVVVSQIGALAETVQAPPQVVAVRRTGWRVPPSDPAALAEALAQILALGASSRETLGLRSRRFALDRFQLERSVAETLAVYAAVLDRSGESI